jgi:hypothetical protein
MNSRRKSAVARAAILLRLEMRSPLGSCGKCPGYVIDHITPLCAGGADRWSNMQWQTVEEAKVKDHEERKLCRRHAPAKPPA